MDDKINVVYCEPGKKAEIKEIGSSLGEMQKTVGGYIEAVYPFEEPVCIVCNEEGKFNGMGLNRALRDNEGDIYDVIAGPCFICDCSGENFGSLNQEQLEKYEKMFKEPEMFISIGGKIESFKIEQPTQRHTHRH